MDKIAERCRKKSKKEEEIYFHSWGDKILQGEKRGWREKNGLLPSKLPKLRRSGRGKSRKIALGDKSWYIPVEKKLRKNSINSINKVYNNNVTGKKFSQYILA